MRVWRVRGAAVIAVLVSLVAFEAFLHFVVHPWQGEWSSHLSEHAISGSILLVTGLLLSTLIFRILDRLEGRVVVLNEAATVAAQEGSLSQVLGRVVDLARQVSGAPYASVRVGEEVVATSGRLPNDAIELEVPIMLRGERLGELIVGMPAERRLAPSDRAAVEACAAQSGIVLADTRLYEQVDSFASLREDARIGRELHDEVAQRLFAVGLQVEAATQLVADDPSEAVARISEAHAALRVVTHQIIAYLHGLHEGGGAGEAGAGAPATGNRTSSGPRIG